MEKKAYSYVRFSTAAQAAGDSLRRQTEGTEEIAAQLKLPLDDTLQLQDRGLSGYTGDNRTKGALGEFLGLVEAGKIAKGSCLIIEHLDRLTRQGLTEAIHLLTGILLQGIDLYTTIDNKHFTQDTFEAVDLIMSAITLQSGHEQSAKSSVRLREAWGNKREEARTGKRLMSRNCPMWLKAEGYTEKYKGKERFVTTHYTPMPERVAVIRQIFEMKLAGKGSHRIATELTQCLTSGSL